MKGFVIRKYYDFLMWLEDIFGGIETKINNHRRRVDDKYYFKYIKP